MVITALGRKLLRDLTLLKGQVVTIALVVACGIASYVATQSTYDSLQYSKTTYYERHRFGDVFAHCKRAPNSVARELRRIPGVAAAYTRITEGTSLPLAELAEPANGRVVSIPGDRPAPLERIHLRSGRRVRPGRSDEVVVLEAFAEAHDLRPGDRLPAVMNGTRRELRIVGTAMSPEYVFAVSGGELAPDPKRFAVLWMNERTLAPAYDLDGAFNDVVLRLRPGASEPAVLDRVDDILEPYGGLGAHGRDRQPSNNILEGELAQLDTMATVVPTIFLAVAAFLLNVVLARLVQLQRPQIATLKAVGYPNRRIGLHYLQLVTVVVLIGALAGTAVGAWLGSGLTELYTQFFRFPVLAYRLDPRIVAVAVGVSFAAAVIGAFATARRVAQLPPAEAMRPAGPATYRPTLLDRWGLNALLRPGARMILREIERRPWRLVLSSLGIAMAVAILVVGRFFHDSMDYLMTVHFDAAMREDLSVTFDRPMPDRVTRELAHIPGVLRAEGMRSVPVRFRSGPRKRDSALWGYPDDGELRRLLNSDSHQVPLPPNGVVLTRKLAEILEVNAGDRITVEPREGDRADRRVRVARLVDEMFGLQGHMRLDAVHELMGEQPNVSMVLLRIDPHERTEVVRRLRDRPAITSVERRERMFENFREQSGEMIFVFTFILAVFAATIAIGVVYNNARVALSMRSRDFASLRVLGFTRGEISSILLGELAVQTLVAIPLGLAIGTWMSELVSMTVDPENYRIPVIISVRTYAFATLVTLGSALVSALLVRRKVDHLDLIGVLKTRE
jgi:putative ABC transport system permease protein